MSDTIPFKCPSCGCTTLKLQKPITSIEDFEGASCNHCGHVMTVDDIKNQAAEIAKAALKKAFNDHGFK